MYIREVWAQRFFDFLMASGGDHDDCPSQAAPQNEKGGCAVHGKNTLRVYINCR